MFRQEERQWSDSWPLFGGTSQNEAWPEVTRRALSVFPVHKGRAVSVAVLAVSFVAAGVNHFRSPDFYIGIMPPYLPAHDFLVALSGALEIIGGAGLLIPRARRWAGWGLVLLLIGVFPANIHMAASPELFAEIPQRALYLRLPLQFVLIAWVLWATQPEGTLPATG